MSFLYFARHGRTADNLKRVFQGHLGAGLDDHGRAQAARLARRMASFRLDAIVSSDLERAVETARIVGDACGLEPALESDFREVDVGTWSGKNDEEIAVQYPEEWAAWSRGLDVRRGGGETYAELADRIERGAARVAAAYPGGRVLVISHGGAIRSYVAKLLGLTTEGKKSLSPIGNTAVTLVERSRDSQSRLHFINDHSHLEGLP